MMPLLPRAPAGLPESPPRLLSSHPAPRCLACRLSAQNPHTFPPPFKTLRGTSGVPKRLSTAHSALTLTRFHLCTVPKDSLYGDAQPAALPPARVQHSSMGLSPGGRGRDVDFSTSAIGTIFVHMRSPQRVAVPSVSLKHAWLANNLQRPSYCFFFSISGLHLNLPEQ